VRDLIQGIEANADVELVRAGGGVFEVERDGALIFSKKAEMRFPEEHEIEGFTR
jgi:selT/selW/selH-like putative selenoprotein